MGEFEELTDLDQVIQYTIPNRIDKVEFDASIRENNTQYSAIDEQYA